MHAFLDNLILNTDSYKASHFLQYPPGTEEISAYVESRGGRFPHFAFFGLQAFIQAVSAHAPSPMTTPPRPRRR